MSATATRLLAPLLLLVAATGCKSADGPMDLNKPVPKLLARYTPQDLEKAGVIEMIPPAETAKFMLAQKFCKTAPPPPLRAEFRPDGTWSQIALEADGRDAEKVDGTWVQEPACFRVVLGGRALGCLHELGEVFRGKKDGTAYVTARPGLWIGCPSGKL